MNLLTTTSSSPLLLLLLFFLFTIQGQKEDVAVAPGPSGEKGAGQSLCETSKWDEYLSVRKNAESPSNKELIFEAEAECKTQLRELAMGMFGPPRFWEIFKVACSNQCDAWDGLVGGGLAVSRCSYEELDIVDQSVAFWQCKILYDCYENEDGVRDPLAHRENFCNGCGTSQTTEEKFYEELDCGDGISKFLITKSTFVLTFVVAAVMALI